MEKSPDTPTFPITERTLTEASDLEGQLPPRGRITYADDVEPLDRVRRRSSHRRSLSRDSMSIRPARQSVDPSVALPPQFRTLSFNIEESKRAELKAAKEKAVKDEQLKKEKAKSAEIEFTNLDYHTAPVGELFSRYHSSRGTGLTNAQAAQLLKTVGPNVPTPPPSRWFKKTIGYLYGGFGSILFVAATLVFIAWEPLGEPNPLPANLALAIVLVLVWVIQAAFSFWQDFSSSRVMASITTMLPDQCIVLRDGTQQRIDGRDVVPGDVLRITMGNKLPADVRFVEVSSDARFDRSILTGETVPLLGSVDSTDTNYLETACIGMAGTHCVSGSAWGLVLETGDCTVFGRIAKLTSAPKEGLTPLQREIYYFVAIIVSLMLTFIVVVCIVWGAWLRQSHPDWISVPALIVDCVSVAVAFIPEGLPIAVTASLTITAGVLKRNKVLCKSLKTVETLGAVNVICSDKTGTLTKNVMRVTEFLVGKESVSASEAPKVYGQHAGLQKLADVSAACNDAEFDASMVNQPVADRKVNGDATDSAILRFAESMKPASQIRSGFRSIFKIAFNSKNKFAIHVAKPETETAPWLMIKGAPDILLPRCGAYINSRGFVERLEEADRQSLERQKDEWSSQGRRVILLAQKPIDGLVFDPVEQPREYERDIMGRATSELCLVGLIAIVDPPRAEIPEVIRILRGAGIRVFMVTGDFRLTAAAIARECGIVTQPSDSVDDVANLAFEDDYLDAAGINEKKSFESDHHCSIVLSGFDLDSLDDSQWDKLCRYDAVVFARTTPEHKLRIVKELQKRNLTVGMTGEYFGRADLAGHFH
jgi:sodium/potassium-transporting ATPase subunit alpha